MAPVEIAIRYKGSASLVPDSVLAHIASSISADMEGSSRNNATSCERHIDMCIRRHVILLRAHPSII